MISERNTQMLDQIGRGFNGAIVYCGGHHIAVKDTGARGSDYDPETGTLKFECGIVFQVNGKRSRTWKMFVTLEDSDTYTVRLLQLNGVTTVAKTGKASTMLGQAFDVYAEDLRSFIKDIYAQAIKDHNGGNIWLG